MALKIDVGAETIESDDVDLIFNAGSGNIVLDGIKYPNSDGTIQQILRTSGSGVVSFQSALLVASFALEDPVATDDALLQTKWPYAITITRVSASTDVGTVTLQLEERVETTPNAAGTNVLTANLVADTDSQITTSFSNAGIAANAILSLTIVSVATSPGVLRLHVEYRPT